jgi:hypothetical protein
MLRAEQFHVADRAVVVQFSAEGTFSGEDLAGGRVKATQRRFRGDVQKRKPHELLTLRALPTDVKVWFALPPRVVIAPMQTMMIRANITAYSTAVGPSSPFTKPMTT